MGKNEYGESGHLVYFHTFEALNDAFVGVLWHTGSCSHLVISGSMVRSQPSAYTPRQGILSTIVSLNPGVLNGYLAGFFLKMPQRH